MGSNVVPYTTTSSEPPGTSATLCSVIVPSAIDNNMVLLEHLRDTAVFELTARKLDQARADHRLKTSSELVKTYTRRAVAGSGER